VLTGSRVPIAELPQVPRLVRIASRQSTTEYLSDQQADRYPGIDKRGVACVVSLLIICHREEETQYSKSLLGIFRMAGLVTSLDVLLAVDHSDHAEYEIEHSWQTPNIP
jgi:hypothetical protein